jgi:hypothetical protein
MRRFLLSAAAMVLGLALVGSVEAAPKSGPGGSSHSSRGSRSSRSYHELHGTKFKGGYFYRGRDHYHWTYRYWWGKYGCYTYYCPSTSCWYYWYQQDNCYYPCSYVRSATPVAEVAPVDVQTGVKQIVNVTNNSPGSATAGAGAAGSPTPPPPPLPPAQ